MYRRLLANLVLVMVTVLVTIFLQPMSYLPSFAQPGCQTFKETGRTVCGSFLQYWQKNGGLAQQGFPTSNEFKEVSDLDGKTYTVQYFERAVFEAHPENKPPYDVLLSQLGTFRYKAKYGASQPPSFVGKVSGTDAFIGVIKRENDLLVYVCDGKNGQNETIDAWFTSKISGDTFDLAAPNGMRVSGKLNGDSVVGAVKKADGVSLNFNTAPALGDAGLFRVEQTVAGKQTIDGWIQLADGSIRGSAPVPNGVCTIYHNRIAARDGGGLVTTCYNCCNP